MACLFGILAAAAWMDIRTRRVSNYLVGFGIIIGFVFHLAEYGWVGSICFFIRIFVPVLVFYLFFLMRVLGAGDIKLFSVISSFIGLKKLAEVIVYSFLVGAVFSFIVLIRNHNLLERLSYVLYYVKTALVTKSIPKYDSRANGKQNVIPFSAAIFVGFLIYIQDHTYLSNELLFLLK